jgi:hypothetical protein
MAFKKLVDAQAAYERESRENNAYHHALVASIRGQLKRVGSVKDGKDTYIWHLAFTPRFCAGIIIQTFKSSVNQDDSIRVFWLMDWKSPESRWSDWQTMAAKARQMESEHINANVPRMPSSEPAGLIADVQDELGCSYDKALVLANCD